MSQFEDLLARSLPDLTPEALSKFGSYYRLVIKWNERISLTTLIAPEEFIERHIVEGCLAASLVAPGIERFWDIGSGVGVPGIPVAVVRPDLAVNLVESNRKKAIFLEEAVDALKLAKVSVHNVRFEGLKGFDGKDCVALRAVEKMERLVASVAEVAQDAGQLLVFGGPNLTVPRRDAREVRKHALPGSGGFVYEA